jgi:hypothetical protein
LEEISYYHLTDSCQNRKRRVLNGLVEEGEDEVVVETEDVEEVVSAEEVDKAVLLHEVDRGVVPVEDEEDQEDLAVDQLAVVSVDEGAVPIEYINLDFTDWILSIMLTEC